jgi:hypothetical protein
MSIRQDLLGPLPKADQWKTMFAGKLAQPNELAMQVFRTQKLAGKPFLEQAKELERLYWQNPDSGTEDIVFFNHVRAGTLNAARRFYLESRENLLDSVRTANGLGQYVYLCGYFKGDAKLCEMALEDSRSGSFGDMRLHLWDVAIRDDRTQLTTQVDELITRYESNEGPQSRGARLKSFLPLLPALSDPKDPQHKKAIHYFGNDVEWVDLRWLWVEKFKLPKEDAIAFLGGRETDAARHALVCYLDGDTEGAHSAADAAVDQENIPARIRVLARCVSMKLAKNAAEPVVADLKPAGATSARAAVFARLTEKQK